MLSPFHNWGTSTFNTLRLEMFGFARALAYVVRALKFVACVSVVASNLFKTKRMHNIQTRRNAIQINALQRTNIERIS